MYEYDEEYYEPTIADELLMEYQEKMKGALLETVKNKFDAIEKENSELKEKNTKLKKKVEEIDNMKRQLEFEKKNLKSEVRRERLSLLMKDFQVIMYRVTSENKYPDKCSNCDDNRIIKFLSPSGKECKESCSCGIGKTYYLPQEVIATEFKLNNDGNKFRIWYKEHNCDDYDYYSGPSPRYCNNIYNENMKYEEIESHYDLFFKTEEECKKYCDWKNSEKE